MNQKQKAKGYVGYIGGKDFRGTTLYSFALKNEDKWYRCGTVDPKVVKGDLIEFEYEEDRGGYSVFIDSISVINLGASPAPSNSKPAGNTGYWDERLARDVENDKYRKENDLRIQYQSAGNKALQMVDLLLKANAVKLVEKVGSNHDIIKGLVEDLTNEFFKKICNVGKTEEASSAG